MCIASGDAIADGFKTADEIYAASLTVNTAQLADRLLSYAYTEPNAAKRSDLRIAAAKLLQHMVTE